MTNLMQSNERCMGQSVGLEDGYCFQFVSEIAAAHDKSKHLL